MYTELFRRKDSIARQTISRLLVLVIISGFLAFHCLAESVSVYGVNIPVSGIKEVSPTQVLVSIDSTDEIIDRPNVNKFVVKYLFGSRDKFQVLSASDVYRLIESASNAGDVEIAELAARGLFEYGDSTDAFAEDFFDRLSRVKIAPDLFKRVISDAGPSSVSPRIIANMLVTIGSFDIGWLRGNAAQQLVTYSSEVRSLIKKDFFGGLKEQNLERAKGANLLMGLFFGEEDTDKKKYDLLLLKLGGVSESEFPETLSNLSAGSLELKKELGPIYLDALLKKARESLDKSDPEQALKIISQVEFEKRTPEVHRILAQALADIKIDSRVLLDSPKPQDLLVLVSDKDSVVKESFYEALYAQGRFYASRGAIEDVEKIVALLGRVYPDPNEKLDETRINFAQQLFKARMGSFAERLLSQVQTGIPISKKPAILWARVKEKPSGILLLLGALVGVVAFLRYLRSTIRRSGSPSVKTKNSSNSASPSDSSESSDSFERGPFVTVRGRPTGLSAEYIESLTVFGLDASATLKDIKTAYRNKIKDIHPDHQVSGDSKGADEFLRMKDVYERLLEIRRAMGLD